MTKHPVLQISKIRQKVWLKEATPEDFFEMITLLSRLYAKKTYKPKARYKVTSLLADYPEYVKKRAENKKYVNNVPFKSSSDEPGSVVEEKPETEQTLEELMDLI